MPRLFAIRAPSGCRQMQHLARPSVTWEVAVKIKADPSIGICPVSCSSAELRTLSRFVAFSSYCILLVSRVQSVTQEHSANILTVLCGLKFPHALLDTCSTADEASEKMNMLSVAGECYSMLFIDFNNTDFGKETP